MQKLFLRMCDAWFPTNYKLLVYLCSEALADMPPVEARVPLRARLDWGHIPLSCRAHAGNPIKHAAAL